MSTEGLVNAVGYLRSSGGYFIQVEPTSDGVICIGSFKDVGSYSSTVSYASYGQEFEDVQTACIIGLAKLVKATEKAKPAPGQAKQPAASAPTGGATVTLKGLKDDAFQKAKDIIKSAGFRFDMESKDWLGGDVEQLPDWLKKRVKGHATPFAKPAPASAPKPVIEEASDDYSFGDDDNIPF